MDLVAPRAPEEIFPLEVWDLIFNHLRSPYDLSNCSKVCKAWEKLLELTKSTFLMPKVFPILYKYLQTIEYDEKDKENDEDEDNEDDENNEEDEGNEEENEIKKEATITTILKMRLVSHGWKLSVDYYHQNHPELNEIGFKALTEEDAEDYKKNEPFPLLPYHFSDIGKWEAIHKMGTLLVKGFSTDINPFITRYVSYDDNVYPYAKRKNCAKDTAFRDMLTAFGAQIWTCKLLLGRWGSDIDQYKKVGRYLSLMPNLRSLKLQFSGNQYSGMPRKKSEKEKLKLLYHNEPFPRLKHLKTLQMSNAPYPLSVGILANNAHLHKLSFQNQEDDDDDSEELFPEYIPNVQLPTLMQLAFPCSDKELLTFPKAGWPIKVLHITVTQAKLKNVFQVVSSTFSNTLEQFLLARSVSIEIKDELEQTRLDLPKLRMFQLDILSELETIDFLQGCTALQEIQLAFKAPHKDEEDDGDSLSSSSTDEENNEVIQFKDCITSMNQSNIWRIFNKLECIKIKTLHPSKIHKFTRRQFKKCCITNLSRDKVPE